MLSCDLKDPIPSLPIILPAIVPTSLLDAQEPESFGSGAARKAGPPTFT